MFEFEKFSFNQNITNFTPFFLLHFVTPSTDVIALHRSNIKLPQNRILFVSKHIYECSKGQFHIMPLYQTDNYSNIQIKEHLIDKYKPLLNRT